MERCAAQTTLPHASGSMTCDAEKSGADAPSKDLDKFAGNFKE